MKRKTIIILAGILIWLSVSAGISIFLYRSVQQNWRVAVSMGTVIGTILCLGITAKVIKPIQVFFGFEGAKRPRSRFHD